ncbi:MAG: hypothetical protein ACR2JC_15000 [Chloroflexota bacterium]|nr:MAG: hypothetical protein DLM70_19630 [Chloroflexota bacterium]
MTSRRARRRRSRQQAHRPAASRGFTASQRLLAVAGGALAVVAGIAILIAGSRQNEQRLARVAGILIVLGVVGLFIGVWGSL